MASRLCVLAVAVLLAVGGLAAADHGEIPTPAWATALPARAVPPADDPAEGCADPEPACVDAVVAEMEDIWEPLDEACAHRAPFALTYLRTTQGFRGFLDDPFFGDPEWMINLDAVFAGLYFDAIAQAAENDPTLPQAWRVAFDAADAGRTNVGQDVLLGMNAHINRDLPVALFRVGLTDGDASRKPDHDRVNEVLSAVLDPIEDELADRYEPGLALVDATPSPADEVAVLELIVSWREVAWRNAERLAAAASADERDAAMASIEAYAAAWAEAIAAPDSSPFAPMRAAYCAAQPDP